MRIGFPRHLFSASVGGGVYNPSAAAAIGMVLAAKDDRMPDCVTRPEPVWADAPEAEPVDEEEPAAEGEPFFVPDSTFQQGEQGTLIDVEEYGPAVQPEETPETDDKPGKQEKQKKAKKEKSRKEAEPRTPKMHWFKGKIKGIGEKVKNGVLEFYDEMTREEDTNETKKNEEN